MSEDSNTIKSTIKLKPDIETSSAQPNTFMLKDQYLRLHHSDCDRGEAELQPLLQQSKHWQRITNKMALAKSIKMYLTIFVATTCVYMVLYQYHISRQPMPAPEIMKPPLYIITPTYKRPEQLAELTRLGYTLKHVINMLWLVVEDANRTSPLVIQTLNRIGVPYEYFVAPMPEEYKKLKKAKPRGVSNRNRGLEWLRANATDGVFYFADDDNTYDISIFEQMRYTKKVSMWPVGLVTKYGVSSPIIRNGKIDGFYDGWIGGRKFPVDMAGFAVSVKFLHERPSAKMPFKPGYEEDGFLKSLAPLNLTEIELLADNCTEILTWHTQTKKNGAAEALNMSKYANTNLVRIDKLLIRP